MNSETAFAMIHNTHKDSIFSPRVGDESNYSECLDACHEEVTRSPGGRDNERRSSAMSSIKKGLALLWDNLQDDNKDGMCRSEQVSEAEEELEDRETLQQLFLSAREHENERFSG